MCCARSSLDLYLGGALKVTYDLDKGQLRVEGPEADKNTFEELLGRLNSSLPFFGMVSTR